MIATYNMAQFLPEAIDSVLNQTYDNFEVVVVDDGSTDNTSEVIKPYLGDPRVRYIIQEKKGQAAAKNFGVQQSCGQYVAFLDADDMWTSEKLQLQIPVFEKSEAIGVVFGRVQYIDEGGKNIRIADNELYRGRVSGQLLISNFIGFGTSMVKKECFNRLGGFNEDMRMGIDYDLWLRFSTCYEFDYVDQPILRYRLWSGQISNNYKARYLKGIETMKDFLSKFPGVVDEKIQRKAWAYTYVGLGDCVRSVDGQVGNALSLYLRALRYKPTYLPAWRAIIKAILNWQKRASL